MRVVSAVFFFFYYYYYYYYYYCAPQHCGSFTAVQVCSGSIEMYRDLLSLSLSPSPMMRRTHTIMAMLARLVRVRH